jgi:hypothetical protein
MTMPAEMITQYSTGKSSGGTTPGLSWMNTAKAMIPIVFCASLVPCENAIAAAERI